MRNPEIDDVNSNVLYEMHKFIENLEKKTLGLAVTKQENTVLREFLVFMEKNVSQKSGNLNKSI